jgi:SAM-dependent methyltransferase
VNPEGRAAVRDAARYLRSVRPVDPEEICDYVEGGARPAVVRQVLREEAFELGFRERPDGTFVPVEAGPLGLAFDGVDGLPERHARRVEELLVEEYGPEYARGESGDRLRERIRRLKADYLAGESVDYDTETALAYAVYHLPAYYAVAGHAVAELAADGLLGHRLRVCEVGAGTGGPALGILDLLPDDCVVEYHAVEPSAAADAFDRLVEAGRNRTVRLHRETAEAFDPPEAVDLLVFANVLSELEEPVAVVRRYLRSLAEGGSCLLVAPADLNTATGLRGIERSLVDGDGDEGPGATAYAPELRLWPGAAPSDRGWSFVRKPDIDAPSVQRAVDEAAGATGEFLNTDLKYAYAVLRTDGRRRRELTADRGRYARLADSADHVTDRVDLLVVKLSPDIGEGNPLFRVGDGSQSVDHYAVRAEPSALNRPLVDAPYGAVLSIENGLLLWNDDEAAYNVVVDGETVVDRV